MLREAEGETVSRSSLLDRCWPPGQGSDEALTQAVAQVRRALADSPAQPRFVATVPRIGYRWVAGEIAALQPPRAQGNSPRLGVRLLIGLALLAVGGGVTLAVSRQLSPPDQVQITTGVRVGKDGQKQIVNKTVDR